MSTPADSANLPMFPLNLYALALTNHGRLALVVAPPERWRQNAGYTFIPAELPGIACPPTTSFTSAIDLIASQSLGQPFELLASDTLYGPSQSHAIDRLSAVGEGTPLPLLRLARRVPLDWEALEKQKPFDDEVAPAHHDMLVRVYRARATGKPPCPGPATAGLLWLTPRNLRMVMRGLPFTDILAQTGNDWIPSENIELPDDALLYVPSDYGERHLLRIIAKYGHNAVFQNESERHLGK